MEKESLAAWGRDGYQGAQMTGSLCQFDGVQTDPETGRTVARYDRETVPLSIAVPSLVARHADVDPIELPPMYDCIDVDALEAIAGKRRRPDCDVTVGFQYAGYTVGIDGGQLSVQPVE